MPRPAVPVFRLRTFGPGLPLERSPVGHFNQRARVIRNVLVTPRRVGFLVSLAEGIGY
jgi:hypothetical protein